MEYRHTCYECLDWHLGLPTSVITWRRVDIRSLRKLPDHAFFQQSLEYAGVLHRHDRRCQTAGLAMASAKDAFAFQKRELVRTGLAVFNRNGDKPGDKAIMVGDENASPWRTCSIRALS